MSHQGWSHVGLTTLDMDRTLAFYEDVLGFRAVRCDIIKVKEGGQIRHVFFDTGGGQLLAFMEPHDIPGVATEYDAGINRGLGVPDGFYHFAFEAGTPAELEAKRAELIAKGVEGDRRSSTTSGPSRSTSRTPTACSWSTAATRARSTRTTRGCSRASR